MQNVINFEKLEVSGATKDEALAKAPFGLSGNATQSYKNWVEKQTKAITDADVKEFCLQYLKKNSKLLPGVGYYIVIESASKNTRERPYKFEDVKNTKGKRKYVTTYQIFDQGTGALLAEATGNIAKAKEITRQLYTDVKVTSNVVCKRSKQVLEGEPVVFYCNYAPSAGAHAGRYIVFGVKA